MYLALCSYNVGFELLYARKVCLLLKKYALYLHYRSKRSISCRYKRHSFHDSFRHCAIWNNPYSVCSRLFVLARFHAAKIAVQMRAVARKSDKKAFTTFFIMTVCLEVGWTPLTTVFVHENMTRKEMSSWFACFAKMTAFFNTVTNVLVYYLRNTAFRQTAKRVTVSLIPCTNVAFDTPVIPLDSST